MFRINISSLRPGVHTFEFEPPAEELELDPSKFKEVRIEARLDTQEDRILAILNASATATLECDRTLRLFDQEIAGSFHVLFGSSSLVGGEGGAFDEIRLLEPGEQEIDLTNVVRDTLLLAVPQRCVAPGAEEENIPTEFGAPEDKIDPRWEALRALKQ
ncbi:MAG: DUF177 domain-containing protein [Rhodothermales bacterium]